MGFVEVRDLRKSFGTTSVLEGVSFDIDKGELVALLGPSGCGKTTTLRIIAGLERQTSGDVTIDRILVNDTPGSNRSVGFVFQNYALFRSMNVYDNIAFGLVAANASRVETDRRVRELIELIGVSGLEERFPNELSGGQRQRVAFARALAPRPRVLLLDEPFAAIDAKVRHELRQWLRQTIGELGITSIFVTHDQEEALEVSDRIIVMNEGRIEQVGKPTEIYEHPASAFVAQFAGNAPIIDDYGRINGFVKNDEASRAIVRPEYVEAFRPDNPAFSDLVDIAQEGQVLDISFRGFYFEVKLAVAGLVLYTHRGLGRRRTLEVGANVLVHVERMCVINGEHVEMRENSFGK